MVRIVRTLSVVNVVFKADVERTTGPFRNDCADKFGHAFDAAQISVEQAATQWMWRAHKAHWRRGERVLAIDEIHGNEVELGTRVVGQTSDAEDLLLEVWATLGRLIDEPERAFDDVASDREFQTVTVVDAGQPFWDLFPGVGRADAFVRERLGDRLVETPRQIKLHVPVKVRVGGIVLERTLLVETRFTSEGEAGVFVVQSPLPSTAHEELLGELFGAERPG